MSSKIRSSPRIGLEVDDVHHDERRHDERRHGDGEAHDAVGRPRPPEPLRRAGGRSASRPVPAAIARRAGGRRRARRRRGRRGVGLAGRRARRVGGAERSTTVVVAVRAPELAVELRGEVVAFRVDRAGIASLGVAGHSSSADNHASRDRGSNRQVSRRASSRPVTLKPMWAGIGMPRRPVSAGQAPPTSPNDEQPGVLDRAEVDEGEPAPTRPARPTTWLNAGGERALQQAAVDELLDDRRADAHHQHEQHHRAADWPGRRAPRRSPRAGPRRTCPATDPLQRQVHERDEDELGEHADRQAERGRRRGRAPGSPRRSRRCPTRRDASAHRRRGRRPTSQQTADEQRRDRHVVEVLVAARRE